MKLYEGLFFFLNFRMRVFIGVLFILPYLKIPKEFKLYISIYTRVTNEDPLLKGTVLFT